MRPSAGATMRLCSSLRGQFAARLAPHRAPRWRPLRRRRGVGTGLCDRLLVGSAGADGNALGVLQPRVADETPCHAARDCAPVRFAQNRDWPCPARRPGATRAARSNCDFSRASAVASAACACYCLRAQVVIVERDQQLPGLDGVPSRTCMRSRGRSACSRCPCGRRLRPARKTPANAGSGQR